VLSILSTIATAYILRESVTERAQAEILQEIGEVQILAEVGIDPKTGESFTDAARLLEAFISKSVPDRNAVKLSIVGDVVQARSTNFNNDSLHRDQAFIDSVLSSQFGVINQADSSAGPVTFGKVELAIGNSSALFVIAIKTAREGASTQATLSVLLLLQLFALAVAIAFGIVASRRITKPLLTLVLSARNVEPGQIGKRIYLDNESAPSEISELADSMNSMFRRLESSEEEQKRFIDDAGHELRTPLTIINGNLDLLIADYPEVERLQIVKSETNRMSRIVRDLQLLTRSRKADFIQIVEGDFGDFIRNLGETCQSLIGQRLEFEAMGEGMLSVDQERVTQAALQLVENAAKFSESTAKIVVRVVLGSNLEISVRDFGIGIAPEHKGNLFERFFQIDMTHHSPRDGSGLGLAIVKQIVDGHGGNVEIQSELGKGSTFQMILPQKQGKQ
jgi:signal transduction histidine kinase